MRLVQMNQAEKVSDDSELYRIHLPVEIDVKAIDEERRVIPFIATTEDVDRDGDIILAKGWDFKHFKRIGTILYGHDYRGLPIGRPVDKKVEVIDGGRTRIPVQFASPEMNPFADQVFRMAKGGFLLTGSVGFIWSKRSPRMVTEKGKGEVQVGWVFEKQELLEFSIVPVPSNPFARQTKGTDHPYEVQDLPTFQAEAKGLISPEERKELEDRIDPEDEDKMVVPHMRYPLSPEEALWDGAAARRGLLELAGGDLESAGKRQKFARGFSWVDDGASETMAGYKLPHHEVRNGGIYTVFRGVVAAMTALLGGRGGADIPQADRRRVYGHLAAHYREFEKEAPEFREVPAFEAKGCEGCGAVETFTEEEAKEKDLGSPATRDDLEWAGARLVKSLSGIVDRAIEEIERENLKVSNDILSLREEVREMADEVPKVPADDPSGSTDAAKKIVEDLEEAKGALGKVLEGPE